MKTIEYRNVDKSLWHRGQWDSEPDKKQWLDEATGLPCLIVRQSSSGHLCGYVGVPFGHLLWKVDENEAGNDDICHIVEPGEPDNVWWFGFDCAHSGDLTHFTDGERDLSQWTRHDSYRDWAYVESECRSLAKQLTLT
jgi:hypothetical protein